MSADNTYVLTEIWKARPSWLAMSVEDRAAYFEGTVGPFLMKMMGEGAEILAVAINDNDGSERIDYRYMAIWKLPDKAFSDRLEAGAAAMGFLDYFEQINFSGTLMSPDAFNADMVGGGA